MKAFNAPIAFATNEVATLVASKTAKQAELDTLITTIADKQE